MTCITCRAQLEDDATVCAACGEPVPASLTASSASAAPSPTAQAGRTGVGDAGEGPEDPWGRSGDSPGGGQPPGDGGAEGGGGGAVPPPGGGSGQPPGGGWGTPQPHPSGLSSDVRGWGIAAHLAGLVAALATAAVLGFLAPLLVWMLKRDEHPFIDHHAKEALNFQITVLVAIAAAAVLTVPAVIVGVLTLGLGLIVFALIALAAMVVWIVFPILGAVKAANGEGFRYPVSIRFVR